MDINKIHPYIKKKLVNEQEHPDFPHLHIYNYTNLCQIQGAWDAVTLQCRGLIIDTSSGEVIARPFPKFFNLEERKHEIPDEEPHIYEKYDGSLGILYWVNDIPYIATRGSFTSEQALWATEWFRRNVSDYVQFERSKTYLFEIIYPENRIVVQYDFAGLVFLSARDTHTGREHFDEVQSPILPPKRYPPMGLDMLKKLERDNAEGFVVLYPKSGLRIKLKFDEYKRLHRIVTNVSPRSIWDALRNNSDLNEILERVPDEFYNWVKEWQVKLLAHYDEEEKMAQQSYRAVKNIETRKDQALWLKSNAPKTMGIVFAMLDGKDYKQLIWRGLKPKTEDAFKQEEI